jgi:hypothetical protein
MDFDIQKGNGRYRASYAVFLDNHDEQRLASPEFVELLKRTIDGGFYNDKFISHNDLFWTRSREAGNEDAGFGKRSRTQLLIMLVFINDG